MAWTVPMTFTANSALTAAQLNTHLRDNLMETTVAKASAANQTFAAAGKFRLVARTPTRDAIVTAETTTSSEWTDLATPGPSVTVETGNTAIIMYRCMVDNTSIGAGNTVSFELSGATERDPAWSTAARYDGVAVSNIQAYGFVEFMTNLNPGENTFTLKYRRGSGTGTFRNRHLVVWPL